MAISYQVFPITSHTFSMLKMSVLLLSKGGFKKKGFFYATRDNWVKEKGGTKGNQVEYFPKKFLVFRGYLTLLTKGHRYFLILE